MAFEIIPAIDLLDGNVVRLTQGDYNQVQSYTHTSPADWAKKFEDAGARRIHIVDLNGAKSGHLVNADAIQAIRGAVSCKLELGGGIRDHLGLKHVLELGIDWVILGSLLVKQFELAKDMIILNPGRLIAGLDANGTDVAIEGWLQRSGQSIFTLIEQLNSLPLAGLIYTDIAKDGTLVGPNLDALAQVAAASQVPVIASGGVGQLTDITAVRGLYSQGVTGVIVGKAVLSGRISLEDLFLCNEGIHDV